MKIKKCEQTKCAYNQMGGCQKCEMCGAEPNMVDDDCPTCWNCSHDEGLLRWDNSKEPTAQDIKQALQEAIKEIDKQEQEQNKTKQNKKAVPYVN